MLSLLLSLCALDLFIVIDLFWPLYITQLRDILVFVIVDKRLLSLSQNIYMGICKRTDMNIPYIYIYMYMCVYIYIPKAYVRVPTHVF
jgi:hypothetical protein